MLTAFSLPKHFPAFFSVKVQSIFDQLIKRPPELKNNAKHQKKNTTPSRQEKLWPWNPTSRLRDRMRWTNVARQPISSVWTTAAQPHYWRKLVLISGHSLRGMIRMIFVCEKCDINIAVYSAILQKIANYTGVNEWMNQQEKAKNVCSISFY